MKCISFREFFFGIHAIPSIFRWDIVNQIRCNKSYLHRGWCECHRCIHMAVVWYLCPGWVYFKYILILSSSFNIGWFDREYNITHYFVCVTDLEPSLSLTSNDNIVKYKFILILRINSTISVEISLWWKVKKINLTTFPCLFVSICIRTTSWSSLHGKINRTCYENYSSIYTLPRHLAI